jgi:hypothetical protein
VQSREVIFSGRSGSVDAVGFLSKRRTASGGRDLNRLVPGSFPLSASYEEYKNFRSKMLPSGFLSSYVPPGIHGMLQAGWAWLVLGLWPRAGYA